MVMVRRQLPGFDDEQLFSVGLARHIVNVSVPDGKEKKPYPLIIAASEIGYIPSEQIIPNFIVFKTFGFPFFGSPISKRRQSKMRPGNEFLCLFDIIVCYRPFHATLHKQYTKNKPVI